KVSTGDAFTSAELMDFLRSRNAREIVITGLLAEKCITATALGGIERGFDIFLVPEAVVGKSGKTRTRAIGKLEKKGVKIIPVKEVLNPAKQ
ncbi:MAG TPA: isochorismatase family protein, partial [Bacteroidales bacterium]|nr:isochorismatase family protein [Bacteroidales bacterium]